MAAFCRLGRLGFGGGAVVAYYNTAETARWLFFSCFVLVAADS